MIFNNNMFFSILLKAKQSIKTSELSFTLSLHLRTSGYGSWWRVLFATRRACNWNPLLHEKNLYIYTHPIIKHLSNRPSFLTVISVCMFLRMFAYVVESHTYAGLVINGRFSWRPHKRLMTYVSNIGKFSILNYKLYKKKLEG